MQAFYRSHFLPSSPTRVKLAVHLNAQGGAAENGVEEAKTNGDTNGEEEKKKKKKKEEDGPTIIKNVRDWKAGLPAGLGPRPVRDVGEFEENGAKL